MTHIERLLWAHDCVIIPDVGGFVLQNHPAQFVASENTFRPERKEIVFNPTLRHNDGLLTESYMKQYKTDYTNALQMVGADTRELQEALSRQHVLSLGFIGSFRYNEEGSIVYEPGEPFPFHTNSYGLEEFKMPPLQSLLVPYQQDSSGKERSVRKDTIYIPVSRRFARIAVASAAAVALFFLLSTPVKQVNTAAYTASFIPTEVVNKTVMPPATPAASISTSLPRPTAAPAVGPVATPSKVEKRQAPAAVSSASKTYHIIIASFPTMQQAQKYLSQVDKQQYAHAGIVEKDGKIRIYADKFTDRAAADQYIATLKNTGKYKDAWMFISR